ncbi:dienelactone hydrolase family protein [Pareuzebyella sediminis]|uniref:dienelactone hydrolase family protein n=1 Tax=Pareuzebyella sediminis TaxID=2607998 RepID=UPI0011EFB503|nr:dienelactone hydrolase family protein [Pareuzebyella sediminis]
MKLHYFILIFILLCCQDQIGAQTKLTKSEKSFSKIKTKSGTRDETLTNTSGKRWKARVSFPEKRRTKNSLVIALHWAGGEKAYKDFNDCLVLLALKSLNAIIISPEGENQLWSTANNIDKIRAIVTYSKKYWNVNPDKIAILGYSNGGNGSWYFAEHYPTLFSAAIPMASSYPIYKKIAVPLYVIHGEKDELFSISKTRKWVEKTKNAGTELIFASNEALSHYEGCSYVTELKRAGIWLQNLWEEK